MEPRMFGRSISGYLKITWPYVLSVFLIGQIQVGALFYFPPSVRDFFNSIPQFLRLSQALWGTVIVISLSVVVRKNDFTFRQIQFLGLLYFIAFGVFKVFVRAAFLHHNVYYLLLGNESALVISSPLVESAAYIFLITITVGWGFLKGKEQSLGKKT